MKTNFGSLPNFVYEPKKYLEFLLVCLLSNEVQPVCEGHSNAKKYMVSSSV
jgi:hypothetical protein